MDLFFVSSKANEAKGIYGLRQSEGEWGDRNGFLLEEPLSASGGLLSVPPLTAPFHSSVRLTRPSTSWDRRAPLALEKGQQKACSSCSPIIGRKGLGGGQMEAFPDVPAGSRVHTQGPWGPCKGHGGSPMRRQAGDVHPTEGTGAWQCDQRSSDDPRRGQTPLRTVLSSASSKCQHRRPEPSRGRQACGADGALEPTSPTAGPATGAPHWGVGNCESNMRLKYYRGRTASRLTPAYSCWGKVAEKWQHQTRKAQRDRLTAGKSVKKGLLLKRKEEFDAYSSQVEPSPSKQFLKDRYCHLWPSQSPCTNCARICPRQNQGACPLLTTCPPSSLRRTLSLHPKGRSKLWEPRHRFS